MIPLTTKLPAICSLLQRVLEMEEAISPGQWFNDGCQVISTPHGRLIAIPDLNNAALIALNLATK